MNKVNWYQERERERKSKPGKIKKNNFDKKLLENNNNFVKDIITEERFKLLE